MKILKKSTQIIAILLLLFRLSFLLLGCKPKMHEEGYFTYYYNNNKDAIILSELTELGRQQNVLVIPEEINGTKVTALSKWTLHMWDAGLVWESENLEKVFFTTDSVGVEHGIFKKCPNLRKLILTAYDGDNPRTGVGARRNSDRYLYISKKAFERYLSRLVSNMIISKEEALDTNHSINSIQAANVSYYYNYDTDKNDGYYWIDDVEYGEKKEYIPSDPVREEYEFGGWYKEAECINKWDFQTDTLPEEQFEEVEVEATLYEEAYTEMQQVYQETKLYAKWIEG